MSNTAMKQPSSTPVTHIQVLTGTRSAAADVGFIVAVAIESPLFGGYRNDGRHAGRKQVFVPLRALWIKHDLDRNPLHDLREIAGRIVRRQESEFIPRAGSETVHMSIKRVLWKRIDLHFNPLTRAHIMKLGFLEVSDNPWLLFHQRH